MSSSQRSFSFVAASGESGFTRVELLVFIFILVILAGVAYGPVSDHLDKFNVNHAVEKARTIDTLLSQYATDNNGVYPVGEGTPAAGKSEGIARNLLENAYTPDATVFAVGSTPRYAGKTSDYSELAAANMSWDFTAGETATTGITAAASDYLPVLYTTGESVDYASAEGHGLTLAPSGKGPFGDEGIVAAYKGGSARFIPAQPDKRETSLPFILSNFSDTGTYTQVRP